MHHPSLVRRASKNESKRESKLGVRIFSLPLTLGNGIATCLDAVETPTVIEGAVDCG